MYCVDSWAWIEYFEGSNAGRKAAKFIESSEPLVCSQLTLFEVYFRLLKAASEQVAREHIQKMRGDLGVIVQQIDDELIEVAAKIKLQEGLAMADAFVAATARRHGAQIVTGDPDFKKLPETIFIE